MTVVLARQNISAASRRRNPLDLVMNSRLGRLLGKIGFAPRPASSEGLLDLAGALLSLRGKASGPAIASALTGAACSTPAEETERIIRPA